MHDFFLKESYQKLKNLLPNHDPNRLIVGPDSPWAQNFYLVNSDESTANTIHHFLRQNAQGAFVELVNNQSAIRLLEDPKNQTLPGYLCHKLLGILQEGNIQGNIQTFQALRGLEPMVEEEFMKIPDQSFKAAMLGVAATEGYALNYIIQFAKQLYAQCPANFPQRNSININESIAVLLAPRNNAIAPQWSEAKQHTVINFLQNLEHITQTQRRYPINYGAVYQDIAALQLELRGSQYQTYALNKLSLEIRQDLMAQCPILLQQIPQLSSQVNRFGNLPSGQPHQSYHAIGSVGTNRAQFFF